MQKVAIAAAGSVGAHSLTGDSIKSAGFDDLADTPVYETRRGVMSAA